jgi:mevalonate kinase
MNNRLDDLPDWAREDDDSHNSGFENEPTKQGDVEMGNVQQAKHMEHFFREVESIKADIEVIKNATKGIADINEAALQATTTEEENELSKKMRPLVDQTNKRAKRTKDLLGLLKEETKKLQAENNIKQSDLR